MVMPGEKRFIPFSTWVENNFYREDTVNKFGKDWDFSNAKLVKLHPIQKRICDHVLTPDKNGQFPYSIIVYSTIKKEGKTTLAGMVGAWFAACIEPPNLILTLANDQEQSAGRIFGAMTPTLNALGCKVPTAVSSKPEVRLPNGSVVQAIANNYAGAAGANYGLTLWSELWAYTTERSRRLYDELVPVPTKLNSIKWIETYVGFEDESFLLLDLFKRIFTDTNENQLQDNVIVVPELEDIESEGKPTCYAIPEEGIFYFHNHSPFMGPTYVSKAAYDKFRTKQKADLRPPQYIRLWENRWQKAEGNFVDPDWFDDACIIESAKEEPMILAGDASQRNDTVSLIGIKKYNLRIFGQDVERFKMCFCRIWDPKFYGAKSLALGGKLGDMDLDETIAQEIIRLWNRGFITGPFWYDPYQLHQVAVNLRKKKIPCAEFNQGTERLFADSFLGDVFRKGELDLFYHPILEEHVKNAKVIENEHQQVRITKGKIGNSTKIDGAVALSMAVWKASQFRPNVMVKKTSSSRRMR